MPPSAAADSNAFLWTMSFNLWRDFPWTFWHLDEALAELHELDERQAKIVELRFFAGLSITEIAELLEMVQGRRPTLGCRQSLATFSD